MRVHTVDYNKRDRGRYWKNIGVWLHDLPRVRLGCRLFGHRPVVDGTTLTPANNPDHRQSRWVVCDRCGLRPEPQGSLDPAVWNIGDRYDGPWQPFVPRTGWRALKTVDGYPPGPFDPHPTGTVGWQFVAGVRRGEWTGAGFNFKVGNGGSEHTLELDLHLWPVSLYLWTEGFGAWLIRRFNPTVLYSRDTGLRLIRGRIEWKVWAIRDNPKTDEPRWRNSSLSLRWRDKLFGPKRYDYTPVPGGEVARVVRMPEGDYLVNLKLERVTYGRKRLRRKYQGFSADWSALGPGIPTKGPLRGRVFGSAVKVPPLSVDAGTWPAEAVAGIVKQITEWRTSHEWEPTGKVPIEREEVVA